MGSVSKEQVTERLDFAAFFGQELERLTSVQGNGEAKALCPFHDDKTPSLSVNFKTGEYFCHACQAKGDAFTFVQERYSLDFPQSVNWLASFAGVSAQDAPPKPARKELPEAPATGFPSRLFTYFNPDGSQAFQVGRWEKEGCRKAIRPGHVDETGTFRQGMKGAKPVPYNLPGVLKSSFVVIVEGENKAEALQQLGICGTCNQGGAGKWKAEYGEHFKDKGVVILPDNDDPGREHAEKVATALFGVAAYVKVVDLPGLPLAGDIVDWLEAPGNDKERLQALMNDAPEWKLQDAEPEESRPLQVDLSDFSGLYYLTNYPPAYEYLFKPTFVRGEVGAIVGPPSVGKGMMSVQIATQLAAGLPIFTDLWGVEAPTRVLYLSAEDSKTTVHRRVHHAMLQLPQEVQYDAARRLHAVSVRGRVHLCQGERNSEIKLTKNLEDLRAILEQVKPGLLFLDTLSRFLGIDENDNPAMTAACVMLEELVGEYGCNIIMLHHTNKAAGDRVDKKMLDVALSQTAIRGASAFAGAVRWTLNLASLSQKCAVDVLGDEAKGKAPGAFIAMQVSMSNNGISGFRRYFGRGEQGLLYPVEPIDEETAAAAVETDARKLAEEVRRREATGEPPLSVSKGGREAFEGWGDSRNKKATEKAIQLGLLDAVDKEKGKGKVLSPVPPKTGQDFGMFNYDD